MLMQKLREQTNSLPFKIIVGAIIFVLAIFGFGAINLFAPGDIVLASVNGDDITQAEVGQEAERERQRIAAQFGENFDPALIDNNRLFESVISRLISRRLLTQAADDLGLGVSESQLGEVVATDPAFAVDGRFDESAYRTMVRSAGYTPKSFLETTRKQLLINQLTGGVSQTAVFTDWELRQAARFLGQTRDLAYLAFERTAFSDSASVTDEDVATYYEENQQDFLTPETLSVRYVQLTRSMLMDDPSLAVTEDDLRTAYETEKANWPAEEQRASSHILLQVNDDRSDAEAQQAIARYRQQIADGADFAEIAREHSEDPGSAADGGRLGAVGKGVFDPAYESALWALESPGDMSPPVKSAFGYHLVRLDGIEISEIPAFETYRGELERQLKQAQVNDLLAERLAEMDQLAFENPESLEPIAEALGLVVAAAEGVTRNAGAAPFDDPAAREALFTEEVVDKGYNTVAVQTGNQSVVVARVTDRQAPEPKPLTAVAEDIRAQLLDERARAAAQTAFEAALARVRDGDSVLEVARSYDLQWQTHERIKRTNAGIPPEVMQTAFDLEPPAPTEKRVSDTTLSDGTPVVVTLTAVNPGELGDLTDSEINQIRTYLENRAGQLDLAGLYGTVEQEARIKRR